MKIKHLIVFAGLAFSTITFSQKHWDYLFNNDRNSATEEILREYQTKPSIENFLSRQIVCSENGMLANHPSFMESFLNYEESPFYLYVFWNKQYMFTDYFSSGFNTLLAKNIGLAHKKNYDQQTVHDALVYLKAISSRHFNDFETYRKLNKEIPSIREWQYCGVFENMNSGGIDRIYGPETTAVSTVPFEANSNGLVNWYNSEIPTYEAYRSFRHASEYGSGTNYAQSFLSNPVDREVVIRVGCSSKFKIWLDDALIYENPFEYKTDIDAYNIKINLPKGDHRLLIKVADQSSSPYFIVRMTDDQGFSIGDIAYSAIPNNYEKLNVDKLNPRVLPTVFEDYFQQKMIENPDNFFYVYCLFNAFLRNGKFNEAKNAIEKWYEKYPNSSMLRYMMLEVYDAEDEGLKIQEIKENLILEDPDYHVSMTFKFADVQELMRTSIDEMQSFLRKYADIWDDEIITASTEFIIALRLEDKAKVKFYLDQLTKIALERGAVEQIRVYIPLYSSLLNDNLKYKKLLESTNKKYFDYALYEKLELLYDSEQKHSKVLSMLKSNVSRLDSEADALFDIIDYMHYRQQFNESMPYIDKVFTLFPYSFRAMELKGDAYLYTGRFADAIVWYEKSLQHNSENLDLRKRLQDLKGEKDIVETYKIQDVYKFIRENRNKTTNNNYGYNILLDEALVELYKDAGGKARYTLAIEITSEQGVEQFKEYDLGLYGNYNIIKSEIVKKSGSVNPGDRAGSSIVFTNLEPKDVIYLDYQISFTGYGRFFRDYDDNINMGGGSPIKCSRFTLISPKEKEIFYKVVNLDIPCKISETDNHNVYQWLLENYEGSPKSEEYMPADRDIAAFLHISTISDWTEISNWYSDLVRPQLIEGNELERDFKVIFPDGVSGLTDDQKAEKIYYYIMNNFNYSSVSFRQSGYVPQKPSTTISTKLGDCKDFSALFVVLAKKAGLEANMVLCLTADFGRNAMVLPNKDFNHCIVKVLLNGEEQFLELTDKHLPYKAIPAHLIGSTILEIPYLSQKDHSANIRNLENPKRIPNSNKFEVEVHLKGNAQAYIINSTISGGSKPSLAEVLNNPNTEIVKTEISDRLQRAMDAKITIDSIYNIENTKENDHLKFTVNLTMNEKLNKIGDYKIWKIPSIMNVYTDNIISLEKRAYPIVYNEYENSDHYSTEYTVFLDDEGEFTEIPKNKTLTFKKHTYSITYTKIGPKKLKIVTTADLDMENIAVEDYAAYKEFVTKVLEANEELVGFK